MHWINRGAEPNGLAAVRSQYTQAWIDHYQRGAGSRPIPRWRQFRSDLRSAFSELCGYCEEETAGEIDHFRPVSKCPSLVYEWSNWIFACPTCNREKSNKWPLEGYIDPCAGDESERPEQFFTFNTRTGELIPESGLSDSQGQRARQMIGDISLNASFHLKKRRRLLRELKYHLDRQTDDSEDEEYLSEKVDRESALSSLARALLEERGFIIED